MHEHFFQLGMNCLLDYVSVNKTGRKVELVAKAFAAFEIKLPIITLSEEQHKKLKLVYEYHFQKFKICDPLSIATSKRIDDILQGRHIDTRVVFAYTLKVNDYYLEHVGRCNDQKAYSYFDNGFVNSIFINNPSSCRNSIFFIY